MASLSHYTRHCRKYGVLWHNYKQYSVSVPRITIPQRMVDKLHKEKVKRMENKSKQMKRTGRAVIQCRNSDLNHYKGQKYAAFGERNLASGFWKNRKHHGDYFTINAIGKNPAMMLDESVSTKFEETGLREEISKVLQIYDITTPTNIQSLTIPGMLKGSNVLCTAETGSGKTLAYLLPIIQAILDDRDRYGKHTKPNQPLGVVVVPTHELVAQVCAVASDLAEHLDFKVVSLCGRNTSFYLKNRTKEHMDILVAPPGILSKAIAFRILDMSRLSLLVLDEADTLLDDSFNYIVSKILTRTTDQISKYQGLRQNDVSEEMERDSDELFISPCLMTKAVNNELRLTSDNKYYTENKVETTILSNRNDELNKLSANCKDSNVNYQVHRITDELNMTEDSKMVNKSVYTHDEENSASILVHDNEKLLDSDKKSKELELLYDQTVTSYNEVHKQSDHSSELFSDENNVVDNLSEYGYNLDKFKHEIQFSPAELDLVEPMGKVHVQDSCIQFCMVGATIPTDTEHVFGSLVPEDSIHVVRTKSIHRILPHVAQRFIRATGVGKVELILKALKTNIRKQNPTIVFCNNVATVKFLMYTFEECGVKPVSVLYSDKSRKYDRRGVFDEWESGKTDVLLCTDLASRGLDTTRAKVVINYDFPRFMADYIHRAGRVGRVGSEGTGVVVSYVHQKWEVDLLWKIELATRKEMELWGVDGNIKGHHEKRHKLKKAKQQKVVELHV